MIIKKLKAKRPIKKNEIRTHEVQFLPFNISVNIAAGLTLLEAARNAKLPIQASCGGKGTCGDCLIQVKRGKFKSSLSLSLPDELTKKGYVLACRTKVRSNLTVTLPEFEQISIQSVSLLPFFEKNKDMLSGHYEVNPAVKAISLNVPLPSLENSQSDLRRLYDEIHKKTGIEEINCEYSVLKKLARTVRTNKNKVTVIMFFSGQKGTILDIRPWEKETYLYGLACDLGTTSIVLSLVNLEDGRILKTSSCLNRQVLRGEDVISRINYARTPENLKELHEFSLATVNELIEKITASATTSFSDIFYASFSGNTTMTHLFLNLEPENIRLEPYVPTLNVSPFFSAKELGLKINPEAKVYLAPLVGSYVGGDITAGLLCTPLLKDSEKVSLFIDAGTNGEIVVGNNAWLMGCACSAGPAFEGGGIRCGMPASSGAIEKLNLLEHGEPVYSVINGQKPKGLCGSGLVDLLSELFIHNFIDRSGKFNLKKASSRWIETERGMEFLIEERSRTYWGKDLSITEREIANLILTKAAVFSACSLLLKKAGLSLNQIDALYLAGGFGFSLNIENAIRIGLLPDLDRAKFHYLGNSSLLGAYLILLSDRNRLEVERTSEKMTYVELSTTPDYMNEFTAAMFLPHTDIRLFPSVKGA